MGYAKNGVDVHVKRPFCSCEGHYAVRAALNLATDPAARAAVHVYLFSLEGFL